MQAEKTITNAADAMQSAPVTMSLCVREGCDRTGRWIYSRARSVETAVREAISPCLAHGYALGESTVTVWEGEHATPVGAPRLGIYRVTTARGAILSMEVTA